MQRGRHDLIWTVVEKHKCDFLCIKFIINKLRQTIQKKKKTRSAEHLISTEDVSSKEGEMGVRNIISEMKKVKKICKEGLT
jgi:hypothetical protein